jgi:hypothetical protein
MNMELRTKKMHESRDCTISRLFINGVPSCLVLQDGPRPVKVYGETRIPQGRYELKLRKHGGFHAKYQRKYGEWHKGMIELMNVPEFKYILIHIGNDNSHTAGCLLTGTTNVNSKCFVGSSEKAYKALYPTVAEWLDGGKRAFITVDYK